MPSPDHPRAHQPPEQGRAHDAYRRGQLDGTYRSGLGGSGWRLDQALSPHEPRSVPELVALTGKSRATIYRRLRQLLEAGLAEQVDGGYRAATGDLDQAAEQLGTRGLGARQRQRHREERDRYKQARDAWQDELAQRRARRAAERAAGHLGLVDPATGEVLVPAAARPDGHAPHGPPAGGERSA